MLGSDGGDSIRRLVSLVDLGTGWYENWYFNLRLDEEIMRAVRYGRDLSLVGINIGRPGGRLSGERSRLHARLADIAYNGLRATDIPGNLGSFTYAVALTETDRGGAEVVAIRLREALADFLPVVAVACFPEDGETLTDLMAHIGIGGSEERRAG
jgi:hypothetical protein